MRKKTVRRRIFISNALMVVATLLLFLFINAIIIKRIRNQFIVLFFADGVLCIAVLVIISQLFTRNL